MAITSPVTLSGHVDTTVTCETPGARYVASASGSLQGYQISESVRVSAYRGPGTYHALVAVSVLGPSSQDVVTAVPTDAQISASGGSVVFSASTSGGRTLAGSISWACSA
ncbi:hypothetical protein [Frankia sp. AgB32]|uniref:hypothetical protein n=1 Tax=Frankia sp. AgB32 TaxID=631119 RepID=UPI00200C5955|nr:hypothetical protein [Frankia sp. AgB32]MCK9897739.1 hypothetical protein [Frankia sp. AgB32]